jgi:ATP-dependent helicase/nuclease subunit A
MNVNGQFINGVADLVLETEQGLVVIDHKSYPGGKDMWQNKVAEFGGQLECYKQVLEVATGKKVVQMAVHFVVGVRWWGVEFGGVEKMVAKVFEYMRERG